MARGLEEKATATLECQKEAFFLPPDLHYLNCAYMAPQSRSVAAAGAEGLTRQQNPTRVTSSSFFDESNRLRDLYSEVIGARDPQRVAILAAVSTGVAIAAKNIPVSRGQNVVLLGEQFPSNYYSWSRRCRETEAELRVVSAPGSSKGPSSSQGQRPEELRSGGRTAAWNTRLLEAIGRDTAVVAMPIAHWSDGALFDVEAVGRRAREVGAAFVIDGTQTVGALPFSLDRVRPDALICAGYKTLHGPYGLAFGYFGPRFDDGDPLEEGWAPRADSDDFSKLVAYREEYRPGAVRYDQGERANPILLPMSIAAFQQVLAWTPEAIQDYCRDLVRGPLEELRELGFAVEPEAQRCGHLFGVRTPEGLDLEELKVALERRKVAVSVRGDAIRIAPSVYNDAGDLAALVEALASCADRAGSTAKALRA